MKKNKTIAYMLAATLLVGGTFVGTKALFTDNIDVAGELAISTGDVDIEVVGTNDWVLDRNGNENTDSTKNVNLVHNGDTVTNSTDDEEIPSGENAVFANNLKPGDRMYKEITIENQGTLLAQVTLGEQFEDNTLGVLKDLVIPSQTVVVDTNNNGTYGDEGDRIVTDLEKVEFNLIPGQKAKIRLNLNVSLNNKDYHESATGQLEDGATQGKYNNNTTENTVVNLNNAWTLDAQQQNPGHSE